MNCPECGDKTKNNPTYNMDLCVNKSCDLYLKDDVNKNSQTPQTSVSVNPNFQRAMNKVINQTDFEKIHKVMTFLNWTWASSSGVPTVNELIASAQDLLTDVSLQLIKNPRNNYEVASGGISASGFVDKGEIEFRLSFIIEDAMSYH